MSISDQKKEIESRSLKSIVVYCCEEEKEFAPAMKAEEDSQLLVGLDEGRVIAGAFQSLRTKGDPGCQAAKLSSFLMFSHPKDIHG